MTHTSIRTVSMLGLFVFAHFGQAQIVGIIPQADTINAYGTNAPPTLHWTLVRTTTQIDTIAILPAPASFIWVPDSTGKMTYWPQISICVRDSSHEFTYQLLMVDRRAMPVTFWYSLPADSDITYPLDPTIKLLVFKDSAAVDSVCQILVNDVFLSVEPTGQVYTYGLGQNYPNPFNPSTTISFTLNRRQHVSIQIYNVLGQLVATILSADLDPGPHSCAWTPRGLPSGAYFYRLAAEDFTETKKLQILR